MRKGVKYAVYAMITLVVFFLVLNIGLLILGVTGIQFLPQETPPDSIGATMSVPNDSFMPIQGRTVTTIYDGSTGQQVGSGTSPFDIPPQHTSTVHIGAHITQQTSDPIRVVMQFQFDFLGMTIPIQAADVTLPPMQ